MSSDEDIARKAGGGPNMKGLRSIMSPRQRAQHDANTGKKRTGSSKYTVKTGMFNAKRDPVWTKSYQPSATLVNQKKSPRISGKGKRRNF
jgi:hypothetical protein